MDSQGKPRQPWIAHVVRWGWAVPMALVPITGNPDVFIGWRMMFLLYCLLQMTAPDGWFRSVGGLFGFLVLGKLGYGRGIEIATLLVTVAMACIGWWRSGKYEFQYDRLEREREEDLTREGRDSPYNRLKH